jgi:hypothetical protein
MVSKVEVCQVRILLLLLFGNMQDIEGVWIDGRLAVVQARPQVRLFEAPKTIS